MQDELKDGLSDGWVLLSLQMDRMEMAAIQDVWLVVAQTMTLLGNRGIYFTSRRRKPLALFTPEGWKALEMVSKEVRTPLRVSCPIANERL